MASDEDYAKVTPPNAEGFKGEEWRAPNGLVFRLDRGTNSWWPKEWWSKKLELDKLREESIAKAKADERAEAEAQAKLESESN